MNYLNFAEEKGGPLSDTTVNCNRDPISSEDDTKLLNGLLG